jgi:RHS repeat-associated protein
VEWFGAMTPNIAVQVVPPDTTPPTVTSLSPLAGATNVNANANVTVTFSEAMDAATVNGSTVEIRDPSNTLVSATVSYNAASFTATLDPTASLAEGVTYTARVRGGGTDPRVKDVAGNALTADVTWTFTTAQNGSGGIKWLVTDHLGSTRMVIDETGSLEGIKRHDYAPFGEELYAGIRRNGTGQGQYGYEPPQSNVRQRYTGKERDDETRLDYFGARYFASVQGRFTSADPLLSSGRPDNPQTWNRYSYVLNNPLFYVDPSGMFEFASNLSDDEQQKIVNAWVKLQQSLNEHKEGSKAYNNIKRSLDRLGRPGEKNGVTVAIGRTSNPDANAETDVSRIDRGKVTITFNRDKFGSATEERTAGSLGHEGLHTADAFQMFSESRSLNDFARKWNTNRNKWGLEFEAAFVNAGVHEAMTPETPWVVQTEVPIPGKRLGLPGFDKLWDPSWKNVDRQTIENNQGRTIGNILQTPRRGNYGTNGYGLKRPR